jgi:hypothetical protein
MSEDRRSIVIVPEEHKKTRDGIAAVFGYIVFVVFVIAVLDHYFTIAWIEISSWLK